MWTFLFLVVFQYISYRPTNNLFKRMTKFLPVKAWLILALFFAHTPISKANQLAEKNSIDNNHPLPNIILIVGESHRAEALSIAGNPFIKTPNLDHLAENGLQFRNAHVTTAICSVSRASILSGQHQARHGINDFTTGFTSEAFQETLPLQLKQHGYSLAWIGPYGVANPPSKDAFDYWDSNFGWMENGIHHTDNVADKTMKWLENIPSDSPFFIQLNFNAAHEIDPQAGKPAYYEVQERFKTLYENIEIPTPESADPKVWESFPPFFQNNQNIARQRWLGFFSDNQLFQKSSKDYYRSLTGVDDAIGKVISKLKSKGLDKNTIIVYISDHGFSLGEHGIMGKWYPFKESTHVPLIIYNPLNKKIKGKVDRQSVALNIDIAPTILEMIDVAVPEQMQGENLIKMYQGKIDYRKQFFYSHTVIGSPGLPKTEALISRQYKYIKFLEHPYEILYDLRKDPNETVNEIDNPKYHKILAELRLTFEKEKAKAK